MHGTEDHKTDFLPACPRSHTPQQSASLQSLLAQHEDLKFPPPQEALIGIWQGPGSSAARTHAQGSKQRINGRDWLHRVQSSETRCPSHHRRPRAATTNITHQTLQQLHTYTHTGAAKKPPRHSQLVEPLLSARRRRSPPCVPRVPGCAASPTGSGARGPRAAPPRARRARRPPRWRRGS